LLSSNYYFFSFNEKEYISQSSYDIADVHDDFLGDAVKPELSNFGAILFLSAQRVCNFP